MRVGIYVGSVKEPEAGGAATFQGSILKEIMNTRSEHDIYIFYTSEYQLYKDSDNVTSINLHVKKRIPKFISRFFSTKQKSSLNENILEHHIDLLWCLGPYYKPVEIPFVFTVWDLQHRSQTYFPEVSISGWDFNAREKFYNNIIPKASYVVIGNYEGARDVEKFYNFPLDRVKPIPLPTPDFVYNTKADDTILINNNLSNGKYLFYPAQFWPHKNHIVIIKALSILQSYGYDFKAVFCGADKGNKRYIQQQVVKYGLVENIKILGFVSAEELISLYRNAFAMLFASMFGPDNIPPLEAMALHCPVICADNRGIREQLGDAALFFNPIDEKDLVKRISLLFENTEIKSNLIEKGIQLTSKLTTGMYVEKMNSLIDEFAPIRECWSSTERYIHL